jgi:integrase/recombinase XerD
MEGETLQKINEGKYTDKVSGYKRKVKKLPVAISEEEFTKLIQHTNKKHHKLAFLLGFGSGLRLSEILKLETRNVRLIEKNILVEQGKGSKDRTVPIPKGFKEEYLKFMPLKNKCGERALELAFKRTCKRAGLLTIKPTIHFHSLRHGFATNSVSKGIPIHHIRTLMGHSNISTTNVYLEMNPKDALRSYEEFF